MIRIAALLCALIPAACTHRPPPSPHYTLGPPYQAGGVWHYPRESFDLVETGLAVVHAGPHAPVTADGEASDPGTLAAAHPTLQLPAIARLTDLDNGRQVVVRINDRGPATPHRMIEVTRHTGRLLDFPPTGIARVRLEVLSAESQAAIEGLPGRSEPVIAAAPRAPVQATPLGQSDGPLPAAAQHPAPPPGPSAVPSVGPATSPLRLPDTVTRTTPAPGRLFVRLSSFHGYRYAAMQRDRLAALRPEIVAVQPGGVQEFRVRLGPFATVSDADAMLDRAIAAGVTEARIVVDE